MPNYGKKIRFAPMMWLLVGLLIPAYSRAEPQPLSIGNLELSGAKYLLDEEQMLDVESVYAMDPTHFTKTIGKGENTFGYGDSLHWVRWSFEVSDASKNLFFIFNTGYQLLIDFVIYRDDGTIYSSQKHDIHGERQRSMLPTFKLPTDVGTYTAVIGVWSPYLGTFNASIGDINHVSEITTRVTSTSAFYIGILAILIAYHLIVWIKMRTSVVAAYLYFAVTMMFAVASVSGHLDMIWPLSKETWAQFGPLSRCLPVLGILWFGYEVLARAKHKFWKKMITFAAGVALLSIISVAVGGAKFLILNDVANMLALVVMFLTGVAGIFRRERFSAIYVAALMGFVIGATVWTMGNSGLLQQTYFVSNAPIFASLIEIMLFTLLFSQYVDDVKRVKNEVVEARNAVQYKEHILRVVGHDLQNPMFALAMHHAILEKKHTFDEMSASGTDLKKMMLSSRRLLSQMQDIVNRVKDMIASENFEKAIVKQHSLRSLIDDVMFLFAEQANQKGIRLQLDVPDGEWMVYCDVAAARSQILANFVGNAIKFSPEGGSVAVSVTPLGSDRVRVVIRDNGDGMPAEVIQEMFKQSRVLSSKGTTGEGGTGFGLAIAVRTATAIGAVVQVESRLRSQGVSNHGTQVSITFLRGSESIIAPAESNPGQKLTAA